MGAIETLKDIKDEIEIIRNSDFEIEEVSFNGENHKISVLLRRVQLCLNSISRIDGISKEEKSELSTTLNELMKSKLRTLNPNFSEETLNNMISSYRRGSIIYPMDINVIDDAVFHKEAEYDDFGNIYKIRTYMFENMRPYYNVLSLDFTLTDDIIFLPDNKEPLSIEEDIYTSTFISANINAIYNKNITKTTYEINTNKIIYGYDGITVGEVPGVNVYIDKNFDDIGRSLKEKKECNIKMCIQNGEDIILYYIHQSFKDNKPIWEVIKTNSEIWKLTDEVLKLENKYANKVLTKKAND